MIDRIGELVQALETGEALASEDDEQLIAALDARARRSRPQPPKPAAAPEPRSAARRCAAIRLSVDLLDRMMSGVSDAVLARNELARRLRDVPRDVAVEAAFERVSALHRRDARRRSPAPACSGSTACSPALPRMVRDLSAELGKQVRLELDGGDVELDREMIEMIRDPLTHIVRNAIDHGIETPERRAAAGKPRRPACSASRPARRATRS